MKRKLAILVLLVLVALLAATPALAAGPGGGQGNAQGRGPTTQWFSVVGIITDLNSEEVDSDSIMLQVYHGNRIGQDYIGDAIEIELTPTTRYRQWAEGGCTPILSLDDVVVEGVTTASVQGTVSDGTFTAQRVTVNVPCCTP